MVVRILVLSEDSGVQGVPTTQNLTRKALQQLVPSLDSRKLLLEPQPEDKRVLFALRGNRWKEKNSPERIRLIGELATKLVLGTVVIFHVDSDTTWNERGTSENRKKFEQLIRSAVVQVLSGRAPYPQRDKPYKPLPVDEAERASARLVAMHPCCSIESWLYQATNTVAQYCSDVHANTRHQQQVSEWGRDRSLLDELSQPKKEVLPDCVGAKHNTELAKVFPAHEVYAVRKSWAEFVDRLSQLDDLLAELRP